MATVLVVDDNPTDRRLLAALLGHGGHRVIEAENGMAGLELVLTERPDLVVSDMVMPRMDGFEFARRVRSEAMTASTRVVFWTASTIEEKHSALARECGVEYILAKPSEPGELIAGIDRALASEPAPVPDLSEGFEREHLVLLTDALYEKVEALKAANDALGQSEATLRERDARLRLVMEQMPGAVWTTDPDLRVTSLAGRALSDVGTTAAPAIGVTAAELFGSDHPTDELPRAHRRALDGESTSYEITWRDRAYVSFVEPLHGPGGDVVGTVGFALDVTDRVRAEGEREQLARRLQMAERLESLGRLAGGVAHDFNNLLAVILNYASFVKEGVETQIPNLPAEVRGDCWEIIQDVSEITRAAERAAALTHQLLIFGRREVVNPEVLELNAVVGDLERLLRRTIGEHIELTTRLGHDLWPVKADPSGIEQVLMNLVVNARDAMAGGGTLVVETANVDVSEDFSGASTELAAGSYVRLSVSDTGGGMSPEVAARAFEPFFTTKPKGEGSGLGLATVYGIVTQAGGHVHLYSEPGAGTSVRVYWPATEDEGRPRRRNPLVRDTRGGGETVLVVEDEDQVREIVQRVLSKNGYRVLAAGDGIEALALADAHEGEIHLLLTDVVLPRISGKELVDTMLSRSPSTRILFMSGYPQDVLEHGTIEGGLPLIEKPFTPQALLRRVREIMDARERRGREQA